MGARSMPPSALQNQCRPRRPRADSTLVKAIARAFRWRKLLEIGFYGTVEVIATAQRINSSYVSRLLLTLPALEIVD